MTDVVQTIYYVFLDEETHTIFVSEIMFNASDPAFTSYTEACAYADEKAAALGWEVIPF